MDSSVAPVGVKPLHWGWALASPLSLGLLGWTPFLFVAVRTRRRRWRLWTAFYLAAAVALGALVAIAGGGDGPLNALSGLLLIVLAGGGAAHVLAIRGEAGRQIAAEGDPRLLVAQHRAEQRERALAEIARDPARARQLGVGRPDVPGAFDAGLIDVNHVGATTLQTLPGFDAARAARVVELRDGRGFTSIEDLDLALDLPAGALSDLRDRLVFVPRA